jgi:hypothetical protein
MAARSRSATIPGKTWMPATCLREAKLRFGEGKQARA